MERNNYSPPKFDIAVGVSDPSIPQCSFLRTTKVVGNLSKWRYKGSGELMFSRCAFCRDPEGADIRP